jgi:hypothetical protein
MPTREIADLEKFCMELEIGGGWMGALKAIPRTASGVKMRFKIWKQFQKNNKCKTTPILFDHINQYIASITFKILKQN